MELKVNPETQMEVLMKHDQLNELDICHEIGQRNCFLHGVKIGLCGLLVKLGKQYIKLNLKNQLNLETVS